VLDGIRGAGGFVCAEIDGSEVAFAQGVFDLILLTEAAGLVVSRVSENEAGGIENGNLVAVVQFSALVPADESVVDVGAVLREVLEDGYAVAQFVLAEKQAMAIADCGKIYDAIYGWGQEVSKGSSTVHQS